MTSLKYHQLPLHCITAEELKGKMDTIPDLIVINVLNEETYIDCHITSSINIAYDQLIENLAGWEKDKEIVLYCAQSTCPKSKEAFHLLADMGFTHLSEYSGGIKEWLKKGFDTSGSCLMKYLHD